MVDSGGSSTRLHVGMRMLWLGISIAALVVAGCATLLVMAGKRLRARRQLADWVGAALAAGGADAVELVADDKLPWSDRSLLRQCANDLSRAGFLLVGTYRVESARLDGLFAAAAVHPDEGLCALVYEHPVAGIGCEALADLYTRGSITVSSFRDDAPSELGALHQRAHRPGSGLSEVLAELRSRVAREAVCEIDSARFFEVYGEIWTRGAAWQRSFAARAAGAPASGGVHARVAPLDPESAALFAAIEARDIEAVRSLVEAEPPLEERDERGYTPLMAALATGHWVLAAPIARAGADLNAHTEGAAGGGLSLSDTFLEMREQVGSEDAKRFVDGMSGVLHALDAERFEPDQITAMSLAIATENAESVEGLLGLGASWRRIGDRTPLSLAARRGDPEVVDALIAGRADPNEPDRDGMTPLMHAAAEGHLAVVERLVAAGADVDARLEDGEDAIEFATRASHREVVACLAPRAKRRRGKHARRWLEESDSSASA